MLEVELRAKIESMLDMVVPNEVWELARRPYDYIRPVLDGARYAEDDLLDVLREKLNAVAVKGALPTRKKVRRSRPDLTQSESARLQLAERELKRLAAEDPQVAAFRSQFLGGGVVDDDRAAFLLVSPASRLLPAAAFAQHRVDFRDHVAGIRSGVRVRRRGGSVLQHTRVTFGVGSRRVEVAFERLLAFRGVPIIRPRLRFTEDYTFEGVEVEPLSVMHRLKRLCLQLTSLFGWPEETGVWFVLTGRLDDPILQARGIRMSGPALGPGRVLMSVPAWLSDRSAGRLYSQQRRQLGAGVRRGLGPRNLEIFDFVMKAAAKYGERPSWAELHKRWLGRHPAERTPEGGGWKRFARDYRRAEKVILMERKR